MDFGAGATPKYVSFCVHIFQAGGEQGVIKGLGIVLSRAEADPSSKKALRHLLVGSSLAYDYVAVLSLQLAFSRYVGCRVLLDNELDDFVVIF